MSSSDTAISVRGLSKSYTIAHDQEKHSTLAELVIARLKNPLKKPTSETFWALKEIEFEIKKGDVVGIIGRNGAGKSTLLKVLSRITEPTNGEIDIYGRVGSLLEVGTGFHPELTGRENVYLNGAILGMAKPEIRKHFDAIVDFAGVEKFLDTPVKRYSSGMYVRLAFAVAAYLTTDILIVDEVLAVGDSAFQKKCLGKMKDVSAGGRTVLFVSHNISAVRSLCSHGLLLNKGALAKTGKTEAVIDEYMSSSAGQSNPMHVRWDISSGPDENGITFREALIRNVDGVVPLNLRTGDGFEIVIRYDLDRPVFGMRVGFSLNTTDGIVICGSNDPGGWNQQSRGPGRFQTTLLFPGSILNEGTYLIDIAADCAPYLKHAFSASECLRISVMDVDGHGPMHERLPGLLRPMVKWTVTPL